MGLMDIIKKTFVRKKEIEPCPYLNNCGVVAMSPSEYHCNDGKYRKCQVYFGLTFEVQN